jgi:hypothetical protein
MAREAIEGNLEVLKEQGEKIRIKRNCWGVK